MGGRCEEVLVGTGVDGSLGSYHADFPVAGGGHGAPDGGKDDFNHGDVVTLAGISEEGCGGGVAGDDEHFAAAGDKFVGDAGGVFAHAADGLGAVGAVGGVADVDDGFVRQLVDNGPGDGEPADAGVEDADGCVSFRHAHQCYSPALPSEEYLRVVASRAGDDFPTIGAGHAIVFTGDGAVNVQFDSAFALPAGDGSVFFQHVPPKFGAGGAVDIRLGVVGTCRRSHAVDKQGGVGHGAGGACRRLSGAGSCRLSGSIGSRLRRGAGGRAGG